MASPIKSVNDSHKLVRMLANSHSQLTYVKRSGFQRFNNFGAFKMNNPKINFVEIGKKKDFVADEESKSKIKDQINVKKESSSEDKVHKIACLEEKLVVKDIFKEDNFGVLEVKDAKINAEIEVKKESTIVVFVHKMEELTEAVEDCMKELMDLVEKKDDKEESKNETVEAHGDDVDIKPVMNQQVESDEKSFVEVEQRVLRRSTRLTRKRSITETVHVSLARKAKKSRRMLEEDLNNVGEVDCEVEMITFGPNESSIRTSAFNSIVWKSPKEATCDLLIALFGNETLATHTLTGKCSTKPMLDAKKIEDIISVVIEKCRTTKKTVRSAISAKCSDEYRMMKKNQQS